MSGWQYDAKAMEFEHAKELETRNRKERKTHINDSVDDSLTDIEFNVSYMLVGNIPCILILFHDSKDIHMGNAVIFFF